MTMNALIPISLVSQATPRADQQYQTDDGVWTLQPVHDVFVAVGLGTYSVSGRAGECPLMSTHDD